MKFVIAPDSFKGGMTAKEAADAIQLGLQRVFPAAEFEKVPMADGGEGTVQSLVDATDGQLISKHVTGPLATPVQATYGILGDQETAVIEMAAASGLQFVNDQTHNPLITTTYGTGELMLDAMSRGIKRIILGIGGSATNDGGAGMAQAIGVSFRDQNKQKINHPLGGGDLNRISKIDLSNINPKINKTTFTLASDVTNPLLGKNGASYVFGKQKGADENTQPLLDNNLSHYASIIKKAIGKSVATIPGSGAAGGLGAGLLAFTPAKIKPGVKVVARETHLEDKMQNADFVFTGEGGTDLQTKFGKTPYGVAQIAQKHDIPVISLAGYLGKGIEQLYEYGFTAIFGILNKAEPIEMALKNGPANVSRTTENIVRLIKYLDEEK